MERDRDARGIALRQELLQSGLSLGMNSTSTDNRRKEESRPPGDTIFSLGSTTLKSRLADVRLGSFASDKGDVTLSEKASRREADNMSGLEDRRSTNTTLQYDPRVDAVRAVSQMSLQSDGVSLSLQGSSVPNNRPLFRPGSMTQRTQAHSGLPPNSHSNDALQKPFSKDPSPKPQESPIASPKGPIFEHGPPPASQQNMKLGQRRRTPNVREGKGMIPSGSPQQQAMQRQAHHQQQQVSDQRESKGVIPSGSMQQQAALQQQALHQQAQQALHQQMFEARDSKGLMSGGVPQQQALQQASILQQQALHQQAADARESKGMMSIRSSQQQALQQQMALQQQHAMQQMARQQQQQTRDARENKGVISPGSPQQQALQQQQSLHQQQATLQQQALHAIREARENKGGMSPGSPQQQALQQQANLQQLQLQALHQRVFEGKGMNPAVVPKQQVLQQQPMQPGRHQQGLESRDTKGMMSVGSPQQQALLHQAALQQQARHQQVLDGREIKGTISTGSPQQQGLQQQPSLDQKALQQQVRHHQVLDSRENKGVMAAGSPQQQSLQPSFHQQPVMALHQQTVTQQALDARESKGMIPSGKHSVQQQSSLQQQTSPQQQAIYQHVLDSRDSKGSILPGSPQQQALQQQSPLQQQASHLQVLETRENKGVVPSGTSLQQNLQQQALHQQALHQQVLDSRETKGNMQPGSPQLQAFQQQALHPQVFEARESKGMMTSAVSPQQQALFQQVLDPRESKGVVGAGSPKQLAGPQQSLHSQVVNARDSRISQTMTLQQQALHKQGLDARESNGMISIGSSQPHRMQQLSQQQAIQQQAIQQQVQQQAIQQQAIQQQATQQAMNLQGRHQQFLDSRDSKSMVPSESSQQQAVHVAQLSLAQQHVFHQQALQQFQQGGTHQSLPPHPSQTLHLSESFKVGYQHPQMHSSEQLNTPQRSGTLHLRGAYLASQAKPEPVELEGTPLAERSIVERSTVAVKPPLADSSSPKESVSVAETDEAIQFGLKKLKTEESRPSMSFNSAAESKDSVRSGSRREGGEGRRPHSQSSGRTSRETMFADLNAEPPASDGEDEGPVPSDGVPMVAQPESSRTTTEEKRKRKKAVKDPKLGKDGEDVDNKKVIKPAKSRAKPKGEVTLDPGMEGDGDNHLNGVPTTKEEKIKSLKAGLVHVARKLPKNAHAHFSLGLMHQRWGHYTKAAQAFRQAAEILTQLEEETGHSRRDFLATVQVHQAQCLLQGSLEGHLGPGKELDKEELESVVSRLKEATMVETGHSAVWSTLGFLLLRSGKIESSIYVLKALIEIVPDQIDGLANLGVAYLHSDELEKAKSCFLSVFDKQNTHPGALLNYATLLLRQYGSSFSGAGAGAGPGAYATRVAAARAAQQCLEAALKEDPKAAHIWVNLAAAYSTLGSIPQASVCLEKAVSLEPTRMSTRYAVAAHRVKDAERCDDANEQLGWAANEMASILREGEFTSIQPRLAWGGLAMVNRAQHETAAAFEGGGVDLKEVEDRALHTLQQAIEEDPADAVQWHQMGLHTLCTLQFGAAQNYLKTAISRRWANPSAWSNLGIALQLSEDPSLAEGVYKQALAIAPKEQAHSILSNLGNLYRQQRKFGEAHEVFKRALDLCPEYAPACNNLGLLLVAEGKWDEAIATFDRSLRADPFLDAAKSNRMKAVALAQMRQSEAQAAPAVPQTSLPVAAAVTPDAPIPVSAPVESTSNPVSNPSAQNPGPEESIQREPFPLPSIS